MNPSVTSRKQNENRLRLPASLEACIQRGLSDRFQAWIIPAVWVVWMIWQAPLSTAFEFGPDEHYELIKGFQVSLGQKLYSEIWNDQPPLHTGLLALAFNLFGPSILVARILAIGFTAILFFAFFDLIRICSGKFAAWGAIALLLASPNVVFLGVSVMLEPAMLSVGLLSCWASFKSRKRGRVGLGSCPTERRTRPWLFSSGLLMGLALQVKLTAVIFLPAILLEFVKPVVRGLILAPFASSSTLQVRFHVFIKELVTWGTGLIGGALLVWLFFRSETLSQLLDSHLSKRTRATLSEGHTFSALELLGQSEVVWVGLVGVAVVTIRRKWNYCFPVILLLTVLAVHSLNRPYWYYYYLHFWIPLAWLGGVGISELYGLIRNYRWEDVCGWPFKPIWLYLIWSVMCVLGLVTLPFTLDGEWRRIEGARRIGDDPVVEELCGLGEQVNWFYTDRPMYAFHAKLPKPPQLVVLARKRFASGAIADEDVLETVVRYGPEAIYLDTSNQSHEWKLFLGADYVVKSSWGHRRLFIRKSLREEMSVE